MKIAVISPLYESVPPKLYGGTERIVAYLTDQLVRQGHDVTLFASGDSQTRAELVPCCERALRLDPRIKDPLPYHLIMLDRVRRRADEFDVLHFHIDLLHMPLFRHRQTGILTTLHGRLDLPDLVPFYACFGDAPVVSISRQQRRPIPRANWVATVHHGLPKQLHVPTLCAGEGYLAFLGRISPEKRPDRAIEIARRVGMPLKMAAKVDVVDRPYFESRIKPMLDHGMVEFLGEIGEHEKSEFLGGARALLFPIDWPEPFGLVMIEAMACGTPVIAWRCGSVPEVVEPGVTGFIVDNLDEAVAAVGNVGALSRTRIRQRFEQRFSAERMCNDYCALYRSLVEGLEPAAKRTSPVIHLPFAPANESTSVTAA